MSTDRAHVMVIQEVMSPPQGLVAVGTPLPVVRRRLEGETRRSLLVVDVDRPIGVVRWRDVSAIDDMSKTVVDVMVSEVPVVTPSTSLAEARKHVHDVDVDLIPVVDEQGKLVGEVARSLLVARTADGEGAGTNLAAAPVATTPEAILVQPGTPVFGADDHQIGTVDDVSQDGTGRISHLVVKQGLLIKHRKRLAGELVAAVDRDRVTLTVSGEDVKRLPDS